MENQEDDDRSEFDEVEPNLSSIPEALLKVEYWCEWNGWQLNDFVYCGSNRMIYRIMKFFTQNGSDFLFVGRRYLRPNELNISLKLVHEQSLFASRIFKIIPSDQISDKCIVISAADYSKGFPDGFEFQNVYFCENIFNHDSLEITELQDNENFVSQNSNLIPREVFIPRNPYLVKKTQTFDEYSCTYSTSCSVKCLHETELIDHHIEHLPLKDVHSMSENYSLKSQEPIKAQPLEIPLEITKLFHCKDGEIIWFPTPPLKVAKKRKLHLSDAYLEFKANCILATNKR